MVVMVIGVVVQVGIIGIEFQVLYILLIGWVNGYLGKFLVVVVFLFGVGYGVVKQMIVLVILGIVFVLVFVVGFGVIDGMLIVMI